jgi:hypothetical protein
MAASRKTASHGSTGQLFQAQSSQQAGREGGYAHRDSRYRRRIHPADGLEPSDQQSIAEAPLDLPARYLQRQRSVVRAKMQTVPTSGVR